MLLPLGPETLVIIIIIIKDIYIAQARKFPGATNARYVGTDGSMVM